MPNQSQPSPSHLQRIVGGADEEDLIKMVTGRLLDSQSFASTLDQALNIETLIRAQRKAIDVVHEAFPTSELKILSNTYEHYDQILILLDSTVETYCLKCNMTRATLSAMQDGRLTVRTLLEQHPRVALAPLLNSFFSSSAVH